MLLRAALLLVGTLALVIGGTFTGITVPRLQRISLTTLSVVVLAWLVVLWRSRVRTRPGAPFGVLYPAWGAVFALSLVTAFSGRSLIALWYMALYAGVWLLLSDLRQRGAPGTAFSDVLIVAAIPLMFWALMQALPWFPRWWALRDLDVPFFPARPVGTFGNPNLLGAFLALALPYGAARGISLRDWVGRGLMALWSALALGTLYLTYSRGAWLGAGGGVAVFTALAAGPAVARGRDIALRAWRRSRRVRAVAVAGCLLAVGALVVGASLAWRAFDSPQRETGARLRYYGLALDLLAEHPLTGTGLFTFGRELAAAESIPPEQPHAHAHNLVLNVGAEFGVPGLLALALTVFVLTRALWRSYAAAETRDERLQVAAGAGSLVAISTHSLVDMPLMAPSLVLAALFALAGSVPLTPEPHSFSQRNNWLLRVVITTSWLAILIIGWKSTLDAERYTRGLAAVANGHFSKGLDDLRAAADAQPWNMHYRAEYAYAAGLVAGQGDHATADEAITAYRQALQDEPHQALWWANLAALEWDRGEQTAALTAIRRAVGAAPKSADLWLNLGDYSEAAGDWMTARQAYERALQLAPRMTRTDFWHKTPLRRVAVARASDAAVPEKAARQLWLAGDEEAAIAWLRRTITRDPTQSRPFIEVARLAVETRQFDRAERYLDAADLLNPIGADAAWAALLRAKIAEVCGETEQADIWRTRAWEAVAPGVTGYGVPYGQDTAQFQFLSLTMPGKLLPQLTVLGPEPAALDAARK